MEYKQLIPFDTAKGGSEKGKCLKNTRMGFGIPPLYDSATEAWLNTEQHKDRNFPQLDVPIYFHYLNPANNFVNDGHIGTRLKNGQFWSDGTIYPSLESYENAPNRPKFLGWGESINNVKVIGEEMNVSDAEIEATVNYLHWAYFGAAPAKEVFDSWRGLLKEDYVQGLQKIFQASDPSPAALKNNQEYTPVDEQLFRKKV